MKAGLAGGAVVFGAAAADLAAAAGASPRGGGAPAVLASDGLRIRSAPKAVLGGTYP